MDIDGLTVKEKPTYGDDAVTEMIVTTIKDIICPTSSAGLHQETDASHGKSPSPATHLAQGPSASTKVEDAEQSVRQKVRLTPAPSIASDSEEDKGKDDHVAENCEGKVFRPRALAKRKERGEEDSNLSDEEAKKDYWKSKRQRSYDAEWEGTGHWRDPSQSSGGWKSSWKSSSWKSSWDDAEWSSGSWNAKPRCNWKIGATVAATQPWKAGVLMLNRRTSMCFWRSQTICSSPYCWPSSWL